MSSEGDVAVISRQLGVKPRGRISVSKRCSHGLPVVITTIPEGDFFTASLNWLTCPFLKKIVSKLENDGGLKEVASLIKEGKFKSRYLQALEAYHRELKGVFKTDFPQELQAMGIDGCRNALKIKCLHAQAAHFLAGYSNPVGEWVFSQVGEIECRDRRCFVTLLLDNNGN